MKKKDINSEVDFEIQREIELINEIVKTKEELIDSVAFSELDQDVQNLELIKFQSYKSLLLTLSYERLKL
jgi:hypothetical protein